MLYDLKILSWLKVRHLRTEVARLLYATGTDFVEDRSAGERAYQLYIGGIILVVFVLLWAALLDFGERSFFQIGTEMTAIVLCLSFVLPFILFMFQSFEYMRSAAIKMTLPDISYIVASRLRLRAIAFAGVSNTIIIGLIGGFLVGFLIGTGLQGGPASAASFALPFALLVTCALVGAWVIGMGRLLVTSGEKRFALLAFLGVLLLSLSAIAALIYASLTEAAYLLSFVASMIGPISMTAVFFIIGEMVLIAVLSPHIRISRLVDENYLYAGLYALRHLPLFDNAAYRDLRRRKILARRGPLFSFPLGTGRATLVTRALLSHLRQFEGLLSLILLGAGILPLEITTAQGLFEPIFFLVWLQVSLVYQNGPRELVRVFREDSKNRTFRDHLPFSALVLLVLDSLPAVVFTVIAASAVLFLLFPVGMLLAQSIVLGVLFVVAFALCASLEGIRYSSEKRVPTYEAGVLAFTLVVVAFSFTHSFAILAVALLLFILLLSLSVKHWSI